MLNKTTLIGNLGADPELRYTSNKTAVANFRIATNETWNDRNGEKQEKTEWHRIVAWAKTAEICAEFLTKGRQVYVEGALRTREWEDRDGNKRFTTEIHVDTIKFLGGKRQEASKSVAGDQQLELPSPSEDSKELFEEVPNVVISDDVPF